MSGERGAPKTNMIGMARLSCLPCRRRKSKCDREEPCSSCVLRSTQRFCYSELEMDSDANTETIPANRTDKVRQSSGGSPGTSPSAGKMSQKNGSARPSKKIKVDNSEEENKITSEDMSSTSALDKQRIIRTIEAMEGAIKCLKESIGLDPRVEAAQTASVPSLVRWSDVSHLMPSKEDCELIIDYFFSDAQWQSSIIHSGMFCKQWKILMKGEAVKNVIIAQMFGIIALTLALAPGYHPASRLPIQSQHLTFCSLAHEILEPARSKLFETTPPTIDELQARCLLISYMSFTGQGDPAWTEVGKTLRMCKALQLYDEDKWPMRELSDWDVEIRRRVALEVATSDRWLSLHHQRISDLPEMLRSNRPKLYCFGYYDVDTGRLNTTTPTMMPSASFEMSKYIISRGSDQVNRFLYNFLRWTPEQRYQEARKVDTFLSSTLEEVPNDLQYEVACSGASLSSPFSARIAGQAIIIYTSGHRLRCTVMRQFLLDPQSPLDLRVAALEHARKIVETTSNLVTVSSNPWTSFSCSWCSGHLFLAASTFAIVYLGEAEQDLQDLNWFASKIFEVIETLSFLSAKDVVSKRCEELLTALCTSKDWLRERFLASRGGKLSNQLRNNSSHDSDSNYSHQENLNSARRGNVPGFNNLLLDPKNHRGGGSGQSNTPMQDSNSDSTSIWTGSSMGISMSAMAPSNPVVTSPHAVATLQTTLNQDKASSGEPWANWPLLNDQQWFALLNTLEQDMTALTDNSNVI